MISFTTYLHIPDFVLFVKKIPFYEIGSKVQRLLSFVNLIPAEIKHHLHKIRQFSELCFIEMFGTKKD